MASTYRTPGVYVEEISKFPPSIADVETAIPAFIGYTEKAKQKVDGDLLRIPVRISAIADYERFFGGPQLETGFKAFVTDSVDPVSGLLIRGVTVPKPAAMSKFLLYYSVRLYFANGGGPCYIISVGNYTDSLGAPTPISADDLGNNPTGTGGLDLLELEDEPTLILFPDAQALSAGKYYSLCQQALAQCNKLQDRFSILDTLGYEDTAPALFRNFIGTDYLKYGAVYYPFLDTVFSYAYDETQVAITQTSAAIFNLPTTILGVINPEKAKIDAAVPLLMGANVKTAADAVTGTLANKITKLTDLLTALTTAKRQYDIILASAQKVFAKAGEFNTQYSDPDVTAALNAINMTSIAADSASLNGFVTTVTGLKALPNPPGPAEADIDSVVNEIKLKFTGVPASDDIPGRANDLKTTQVPALIAAIQANDPTSLVTNVNAAFTSAKASRATLEGINTHTLVTEVTGAANAAAALPKLQAIDAQITATVVPQINTVVASLGSVSAATLNASQIPFLKAAFSSVQSIDPTKLNTIKASLNTIHTAIAVPPANQSDMNDLANSFGTAMGQLMSEINLVFTTMNNQVNAINYLNINGMKLSDIKQIDNDSYNNIKAEIERIPVKLPPCSAVAGKYAQVDRDRGVWKSPANVSLSSVVGPTVKVNNDLQDGLNIDPVAGKSVNVIRTFTGKGTLVWGARTLSGNDNEWRYVSVRRFFIYAEESVKKACDQFVFEPNDANTWVKVRAMIENWLTLQWRAGALAGAKTDDAFYVRIGLGQTMTAVDILEGRMNVEIGMAVVRPAEFIILKFSHKMQES